MIAGLHHQTWSMQHGVEGLDGGGREDREEVQGGLVGYINRAEEGGSNLSRRGAVMVTLPCMRSRTASHASERRRGWC